MALFVHETIYTWTDHHPSGTEHRDTGGREQEHRADAVASLCHLCLLESGFRCVGLAYLLDMCELGCFCEWMCFTGESLHLAAPHTPAHYWFMACARTCVSFTHLSSPALFAPHGAGVTPVELSLRWAQTPLHPIAPLVLTLSAWLLQPKHCPVFV